MGYPPAAKVLESPAWAGVGNLESGGYSGSKDRQMRTNAGMLKLELFGAHLGTPKVGLGAARTCFLGDREVIAVGATREGHPVPQVRPEA